MAADFDCIVVGAGVVGLSCAVAVARIGRRVLVLDAEDRAGEGISSRNSGVIHAGLYYPTGSLKAALCVRGRDLLYDYCVRRNVLHRRLGKLVVATDEAGLDKLRRLERQAAINGVEVHWRDAGEARAREPELQCVAALEVPSSGIVDVPELVTALIGELEQLGGMLLLRTEIERIGPAESGDGWRIRTTSGDEVLGSTAVNAAGHGAVPLAHKTHGLPASRIPAQFFASGHYYTISGASPFQMLIYPLPDPAGLGIHLGLDPAGRCRFGPDLRWVDGLDYRFDDRQRAAFAASVRRWWPVLEDADLQPDFVGVRPKIAGPGQPNADFRIDDSRGHGVPGLIELFGIESPGLTSALAIGERVAQLLSA
jgi:L-2-hydroxyglutarate oxidase LhgO